MVAVLSSILSGCAITDLLRQPEEASEDINIETAQPAKAVDADDLFLEKANSLTVIKDDDSYFVDVERENGVKLKYWYIKPRNQVRLSHYKDGDLTSTSTYENIQPDCEERTFAADEEFILSKPLEFRSSSLTAFPMNIGVYRLFCTEY